MAIVCCVRVIPAVNHFEFRFRGPASKTFDMTGGVGHCRRQTVKYIYILFYKLPISKQLQLLFGNHTQR